MLVPTWPRLIMWMRRWVWVMPTVGRRTRALRWRMKWGNWSATIHRWGGEGWCWEEESCLAILDADSENVWRWSLRVETESDNSAIDEECLSLAGAASAASDGCCRGGGGRALPYWRWRGRAAGQGMILRSSILAQGILWPSCGHQY